MKKCGTCSEWKLVVEFYKNKARYDGLASRCKGCWDHEGRRKAVAKSIKKLRPKAVETLGGQCKRCGIDDYRVLQIDHVDGGGKNDHRGSPTQAMHRAIIKGAPGYQLLCANCHQIKTVYPKEF